MEALLETLLDRFGTEAVLAGAGAGVGLLFGAGAQHSRFCLRASVVELADRRPGGRFAIWLVTFTTAVLLTQFAIQAGILDVSSARQLAATGSLSGAILGGLMFGAGMILARGCASRLLVLSATGNLRALLSGLVLTLVAQASLRGILEGPRRLLGELWIIEGGHVRSLLYWTELPSVVATLLCACLLVPAAMLLKREKIVWSRTVAAAVTGAAIAIGWAFTYQISQVSFDVVPVSSVTFTGPATDTLMVMINSGDFPMNFGVGLVVGVFAGSGAMSMVAGEWKIQRFEANVPMERYLFGAVLMGFGAMLAGGCAVGAGVTGGAIFALTAWIAIFFMWIGASTTYLLLKSISDPQNSQSPSDSGQNLQIGAG